MNGFYNFIERMNVLLWLTVVALAHLLLYLLLGTDHWLFATLAATVTYGALFLLLKSVVRRKKRSAY
ncbi:hypothetical protein [Tumebacillus permanentifrigoris]|uniref:Uncharacterized protein n=1 Tax=Tumebacillus permanentifrigoris TaxID=378543 RepID=A0A316DIC4_9BACL|nr:hypothetical protein [Tumebacillus permanentifrigoris]PWK16383.1 hypothetical protein C7459_101247 [Tumebacillus permanentifrigoris]